MKKLMMILLACTFLFLAAQGQITQGNWMVGGDASFSADHTHYDSNELSPGHGLAAILSPDIGYFFIDKLALGVKADFSLQTFTNGMGKKETANSLNLGPFARYYFLPVENIINLFAGAAYEHWFSNPYTNSSDTYSLFAGPSFFFNSSIAAELLAGFDYGKSPEMTTRSFKVDIGFQIYLKK